jgi:hypothetical protein
MLDGHMGQEAVAQQSPAKHPRGLSRKDAVTTGTVALFQFIDHDRFDHRVDIDHGALLPPLGPEERAAIGAAAGSGHRLAAADLFGRRTTAAPALVAGLSTTLPLLRFGRAVGFEGDFGRGCPQAEGAFLGGALLITEFGLEPGVFLLQPVNDPLLLQAPWAISDGVQ